MSKRVVLKCKECPFETVVKPGDARDPSRVLVDHGRETGHQVEILREEDRER